MSSWGTAFTFILPWNLDIHLKCPLHPSIFPSYQKSILVSFHKRYQALLEAGKRTTTNRRSKLYTIWIYNCLYYGFGQFNSVLDNLTVFPDAANIKKKPLSNNLVSVQIFVFITSSKLILSHLPFARPLNPTYVLLQQHTRAGGHTSDPRTLITLTKNG
jgi:hypothetical protein